MRIPPIVLVFTLSLFRLFSIFAVEDIVRYIIYREEAKVPDYILGIG